jgi:alpha-tubulin suppressor-like RCC1 family protein
VSRQEKFRREAFVAFASLGVVAAILAACADDGGPSAAPEVDSGTADTSAPPDGSSSTDAGVDPDARGPFDPADVPVVCDASPCATQLVAGQSHFCVRISDGTVRCWGENVYDALGFVPEPTEDDANDGGADAGSTVQAVADLNGVTKLSAAGSTTCARLDDGSVKCWGDNRRGQLGLELDPPVADYDPHPTPTVVPLESAASRVDLGPGIGCAALASGKLWCWGRDDQAQQVRPDSDAGLDPWNPFRGPGLAAIEPLALSGLALGDYTALGLSAQGEVWSWGALAGDYGTISGRVGSVTPNPIPKRVEGLTKVTNLVASPWIEPPFDPPPGPTPPKPPPRSHACALANGEVYCWGRSYAGALCTGYPDREQEPAHAPFPSTLRAWPQQLAVGDEITCARMTDGSIQCCGSDTRGRLGTGSLVVLSSAFTRADAFSRRAVQVAVSDRAVCALVEDGTVECWGSNEKAELGVAADRRDHPRPTKVTF